MRKNLARGDTEVVYDTKFLAVDINHRQFEHFG